MSKQDKKRLNQSDAEREAEAVRKEFIKWFDAEDVHDGDCTNECHTCAKCFSEDMKEIVLKAIQRAEARGRESVKWTELNAPIVITKDEILSNELAYQNGYRKGLLRGAEIAEGYDESYDKVIPIKIATIIRREGNHE